MHCVFCRLLRLRKAGTAIRYCGTNSQDSSKAKNSGTSKSERITRLNLGKSPLRAVTEPLLRENIFTIPNALCVSRIALSPLLGYFVVNENYVFALGIFAYAAVTDLLDGWIARTFPGQQSVLGSALDPVADKVLVSVLVLSLTYSGLIPLPLTIVIVGRDIVLVASGFVMRYISLQPPRTLSRYFDITTPSVQLKPTWISKINTGVQLGMVGFSLAAPVFGYIDHSALHALWWGTGCTTVASGLSYVFAKGTYEVLRKRIK